MEPTDSQLSLLQRLQTGENSNSGLYQTLQAPLMLSNHQSFNPYKTQSAEMSVCCFPAGLCVFFLAETSGIVKPVVNVER